MNVYFSSIGAAKENDFDGLLIPDGFSPDILRGDERFVTFVKKFMYQNKPVMRYVMALNF